MNKQGNKMMSALKKLFLVLLVLDVIALIVAAAALIPSFSQMQEYGQLMLGVALAISLITLLVMLFEILAKVFLLRSTSPAFSWASARKGYRAAARLLLLLNFFGLIISFLSLGGEGATALNQGYTYLRMIASVAEMLAMIFYLRTAKKLSAAASEK